MIIRNKWFIFQGFRLPRAYEAPWGFQFGWRPKETKPFWPMEFAWRVVFRFGRFRDYARHYPFRCDFGGAVSG